MQFTWLIELSLMVNAYMVKASRDMIYSLQLQMRKKHPSNAPADVFSGTRGLNVGMALHLRPYFVYANSEGSGKSRALAFVDLHDIYQTFVYWHVHGLHKGVDMAHYHNSKLPLYACSL